jgi:hypothetical protein
LVHKLNLAELMGTEPRSPILVVLLKNDLQLVVPGPLLNIFDLCGTVEKPGLDDLAFGKVVHDSGRP